MSPEFVGSDAWELYKKAKKEPVTIDEYKGYLNPIRENTDDTHRLKLRTAGQSEIYDGDGTTIMYTDETPAHKVLDMLFDTHSGMLENTTVGAVTQKLNNHDPRLGNYWSENHEEFDHELTVAGSDVNGGKFEGSCPFCGKDISKLHAHLLKCPEK